MGARIDMLFELLPLQELICNHIHIFQWARCHDYLFGTRNEPSVNG